MAFTLSMTTTGAAFHNEETDEYDPGEEIARILRVMADQLTENYIIGDGSRDASGAISDVNGNSAALWVYNTTNFSAEGSS